MLSYVTDNHFYVVSTCEFTIFYYWCQRGVIYICVVSLINHLNHVRLNCSSILTPTKSVSITGKWK